MAALGCDSIDKLKAKLPSLRADLQVEEGGRGMGAGALLCAAVLGHPLPPLVFPACPSLNSPSSPQDPATFKQVYQYAYLFSRCGCGTRGGLRSCAAAAAVLRPAHASAPPPHPCLVPPPHLPACREKGQKIVQLDVALAMWDLLLPPGRWQHVEAWKEFLTTHHRRAVSRDTWNQLLDFIQVGGQGAAPAVRACARVCVDARVCVCVCGRALPLLARATPSPTSRCDCSSRSITRQSLTSAAALLPAADHRPRLLQL